MGEVVYTLPTINDLDHYERERLKAMESIPAPWELPRPFSALPWKVVDNTGEFSTSVVSSSTGVVAECPIHADADFAANAANSYQRHMETIAYLRGLVKRLVPAIEVGYSAAKRDGESVKGICAMKGVDSSKVDEVLGDWEALLQEARKVAGGEGNEV